MSDTLRKGTLGYRLKPHSASEQSGGQAASREEQFEAVFLQHWPQVYRLLVSLVGSPAEAEDLALEVFVRLHENAPGQDAEANPGGWLRRVALNLGLDAIRSWKRRERYELEAGRLNLEEHPDDSPSSLLARKEDRRYVRQVLAEMKPRSAQLLILRYSGLSYQEIAAVVGVSPASIGPLLLRAEKEFKQRYRAMDQED